MLGKCHIWRCWVKGSFWKGTPWSCINIGVKLTGRERRWCEPCFMCKALYPDLWEPKVLAFPPWTHSCWWAVNQTGQPLSNKIHNLFYEEILGCSCFSKENIWKCFYSSIFFFSSSFFLVKSDKLLTCRILSLFSVQNKRDTTPSMVSPGISYRLPATLCRMNGAENGWMNTIP